MNGLAGDALGTAGETVGIALDFGSDGCEIGVAFAGLMEEFAPFFFGVFSGGMVSRIVIFGVDFAIFDFVHGLGVEQLKHQRTSSDDTGAAG
jgi:hypothetical protein